MTHSGHRWGFCSQKLFVTFFSVMQQVGADNARDHLPKDIDNKV